MQLSHDDMEAMAMIDVDGLDLPESQASALGKLVQSIRRFLAEMEKEGLEPTGEKVKPELVK